ncbi:hypothetical protein J8J27_26100, partial [Mycobacterium tuberculosis]|nr:hypothetical protein [Mycobacterium tuberculosis]
FVSKDTFEQRTSSAKQAESLLAIDRAAIRAAELNRSYTEIRAPFAGRLGRTHNRAPAPQNQHQSAAAGCVLFLDDPPAPEIYRPLVVGSQMQR